MKILLALSFATLAAAQTTSGGGILGGIIGAPSQIQIGGPMPGIQGGTVTGSPYSAEQTTEHVQTLSDGTHITQPVRKTKFFRDSQGRTRTETTLPQALSIPSAVEPPTIIEIFDSIAGARYTLDARTRTAHKMAAAPAFVAPPPPANPGAPNTANRAVRIMPAIVPGPPNFGAADQSLRPQISHESLGTKTIEGVIAEGSRTTVVYPIGAVGNDRPITTISEVWTSPELKMTVLTKSSDPRNGETTTRLTNISRAEPDPSLFQVPADYELIEPHAAIPKPAP